VNTRAVVDHDCHLGDHVHIAPGAVLSGCVRIGAYSHVGTGASVRQDLRIGSKAIVGVGAAVIADVQDRSIIGGVPARVLGRASVSKKG
jgi:UDP-perosamine 4-acetyltransferase